jgi:hypothetical protein
MVFSTAHSQCSPSIIKIAFHFLGYSHASGFFFFYHGPISLASFLPLSKHQEEQRCDFYHIIGPGNQMASPLHTPYVPFPFVQNRRLPSVHPGPFKQEQLEANSVA